MKCLLMLFVGLGWVSTGAVAAQTHIADSLQALLNSNTRPDTLRVRRQQALSRELTMVDLPRAISILEQSLTLARRIMDTKGEGAALIRLGTLYRLQANYVQARRYTQQAQALFAQRNDSKGLATAYLQFSFIENAQSNLAAALGAALRGLAYAERAHDRVSQTRLQMVIGSNYVQLGNYNEALSTLRATLKNAEVLGDQHVVATVFNLLGTTYQMRQQWGLALSAFKRSTQLGRRLGDTPSVISNEVSVSELYARQGNPQLAYRHGQQALAAAQASHDAFNLPAAAITLARACLLLGHTDSAIALAGQGMALSQSVRGSSKENLRNASDIMAQAYARRGHYAEAYRYQTLWAAYKDSIEGEEMQRKTSALRYGYELDKKQSQITLLTQARRLQRQQLYGLLAGVLGLVLLATLLARNVFLKQRANRTLNVKNAQIAHHRDRLDRTLTKLKATQSQLVQSEKMVALAALTAGVAHEIQNPLNFVNNFSEVSLELVTELEEERQQPARDAELENELFSDLKKNLRKIHQHGCRAGDIVKGMLEHSHADTGQRQPVDLNAMAQDYLRLAYHGLQGKHQNISVTRTFRLDPGLGPLQLVPQEIGRVLLNLFTNAFYAVQQKIAAVGPAYVPEVLVSTHRQEEFVELRVRDNGTGIPAAVVDKIFEPFFTTKPSGEGTGLGLWLSYDIVTKGYGGQLSVHTQEGEYTEFVVTLPQQAAVPVAATVLASASEG